MDKICRNRKLDQIIYLMGGIGADSQILWSYGKRAAWFRQ